MSEEAKKFRRTKSVFFFKEIGTCKSYSFVYTFSQIVLKIDVKLRPLRFNEDNKILRMLS